MTLDQLREQHRIILTGHDSSSNRAPLTAIRDIVDHYNPGSGYGMAAMARTSDVILQKIAVLEREEAERNAQEAKRRARFPIKDLKERFAILYNAGGTAHQLVDLMEKTQPWVIQHTEAGVLWSEIRGGQRSGPIAFTSEKKARDYLRARQGDFTTISGWEVKPWYDSNGPILSLDANAPVEIKEDTHDGWE